MVKPSPTRGTEGFTKFASKKFVALGGSIWFFAWMFGETLDYYSTQVNLAVWPICFIASAGGLVGVSYVISDAIQNRNSADPPPE